ncbi:hypothetical protein [Tellurirhabdus rosea]|uniref:hypothetical protein n=1 Tax=Tellurirhabdus rosea TaxID=2674997 RepID=UPI002259FE40|nr:hypothetical protein [Tellurirhabdus rosea]
MRLLSLLIGFLCFSLAASAQTTDSSAVDSLPRQRDPELAALSRRGSRYLALDRNSVGGFQRFRFYTGQTISFRYSDGRRYKDRIHAITDTSFALIVENRNNFLDEIRHFRLDRVERIYTPRPIPFVSQGTYLLPLAGGVFLLADVVNSGFVNDGALITAGTLAVLGGICYRLTNLRIPVNKNNRLRAFVVY